MPSTLRAAESTLGAIARIADEAPSAQQLLEQASERIGRVVPNDGAFFSSTDPETTLATGMGVISNLPLDQCQPTWDYELLVPDPLKFADIARSGRAVADLHDVTGGRPDRSPRFRQYSVATGFRAEVRIAFTTGKAAWGIAQLNRRGPGARFSTDETEWLERAAPLVARGLRRTLLATPAAPEAGRGPGVVVLDHDGAVVSATREATEWLGELHPALLVPGSGDLPLPFHAHAFAARVRAAHEDGEPILRARLRTRAGVWLLMHGAPLQGTGQFALIIEPAKASDVAPLIVEAYALTQRELDVTRRIARGLGTSEIAAELFVSPHTVRDHVKAIFEKVGVKSRGELVARVFADHYAQPGHYARPT
jgi:DNA-binding CsgD family transcriptional regulator